MVFYFMQKCIFKIVQKPKLLYFVYSYVKIRLKLYKTPFPFGSNFHKSIPGFCWIIHKLFFDMGREKYLAQKLLYILLR